MSDLELGTPWHTLPSERVIAVLGGDTRRGLSDAVAAQRLREHGPNALPEREQLRWPRVLLRQFADALVAILAVAALVSLASATSHSRSACGDTSATCGCSARSH